MTLIDLDVHQWAKIHSIDDCSLAMKLLEMGFIPGEHVVVEHKSLDDDPIAVRVAGYLIGLRSNEAALIHVEKISP